MKYSDRIKSLSIDYTDVNMIINNSPDIVKYNIIFSNFNNDFSNITTDNFPIMDDVYATIIGRLRSMTEKTRERDIMERLEIKIRPFTRELRYYFNGHTSINTESNFLVFNIKELMNSDANISKYKKAGSQKVNLPSPYPHPHHQH